MYTMMWVNGWIESRCDGRTEDFEEKETYKGLKRRIGRVSEAEPNTQSEEAFMIDRLEAFLIFIAAFLRWTAQLEIKLAKA